MAAPNYSVKGYSMFRKVGFVSDQPILPIGGVNLAMVFYALRLVHVPTFTQGLRSLLLEKLNKGVC
jgi:hypothetical protein